MLDVTYLRTTRTKAWASALRLRACVYDMCGYASYVGVWEKLFEFRISIVNGSRRLTRGWRGRPCDAVPAERVPAGIETVSARGQLVPGGVVHFGSL